MLGLRPSQNRSFVSAINFTKNGSGVCEMILQLPERRRFIVWPKKDILFADLSSIATPIANNGKRWSPVKFCFRLIWHHFSYSKSRSIK
jgi:hypothetical protein